MKEIERKFLVDIKAWKKIKPNEFDKIIQGYISKTDKGVVRLRLKNDKGFLTIKSKNIAETRDEFEYEIPFEEAKEMMDLFCDKLILKYRYKINFDNKIWEIDEFINPERGYVLAEIELESGNEKIAIPEWVTKEVTNEKIYYNSNMV